MTITLNGTTGITTPAIDVSTPITVADGGTGLSSVGSSGNILTSNGTSWVSSAPAAGGKVLQVVQTVKTNSFSTTSTSYVDVTGLSVAITPSSASSKILVMSAVVLSIADNTNLYVQLLRNSTAIGNTGNNWWYVHRFPGYVAGGGIPTTLTYLDSPATTSSTTYKVQAAVSGNTGYVGTMKDNTSNIFTQTITVMEIAA